MHGMYKQGDKKMNNMIIIHDQMKQRYHLFCGGNIVEIEKQRKLNNPKKGFTLVFEQELPYVTTSKPDIGTDSSLSLTIRCKPITNQTILYDEYLWIDRLFTNGMDLIQNTIERITSKMNVEFVGAGKAPLYLQQIIVETYPEILEIMRHQLTQIHHHFSYLTFELDGGATISKKINKYLDKTNDAKLDALVQLANVTLTTPYPPEDELDGRRKHLDNVMSQLPMPEHISDNDRKEVQKFLEMEKFEMEKSNQLGPFCGFPQLGSGR